MPLWDCDLQVNLGERRVISAASKPPGRGVSVITLIKFWAAREAM